MLATIAASSMFLYLEVKMLNMFIISLFYTRCIQYLLHSTLVLWMRSSALTQFLPIRLKRSFGQKILGKIISQNIHVYSLSLKVSFSGPQKVLKGKMRFSTLHYGIVIMCKNISTTWNFIPHSVLLL